MYTFSVLFLFVCFWVIGGIGYRYLCIRIIRIVYIIRVRLCDRIYLILFVGWVCLWAWYISSLCMRIRVVIRDRITFRYVIFMVVGLYRLWLYLSVVYLLFVILCVRSGGGFCLSLGWGTLGMGLVPQFYRGLPFLQ